MLALTVAALVAADLIRDDTGFLATLLMGAFLANQRTIDVSPMRSSSTRRWCSC